MSAILKWFQPQHQKLQLRGHLRWYDLPTEFHKNLLSGGSKIDRGADRHAGRMLMVMPLTYIFPLGRKIG
jgi:hypothetical protein